MNLDDLPGRWVKILKSYISERSADRDYPMSGDFDLGGVRVKFEDGSIAVFRYAFAVRNEHLNEIGVFTEHCGYHIFPSRETTIETLL